MCSVTRKRSKFRLMYCPIDAKRVADTISTKQQSYLSEALDGIAARTFTFRYRTSSSGLRNDGSMRSTAYAAPTLTIPAVKNPPTNNQTILRAGSAGTVGASG